MTRCRVSRIAPRDSVTETIIGSSSGVRPTASATANRNDSNTGRCCAAFTSSTNSTSRMVSRRINVPKAWVPRSKAVAGGRTASVSAISASAVSWPVCTTTTRPLPLTTEVPIRTTFAAAVISVAVSAKTACFSTGYDSPVSIAWLTKRSRASIMRPSAGTRSPAASDTTSPGTRSAIGTSRGCPSRQTVARTATVLRRRSTARPARYSCTKSSSTLISTISVMTTKLRTSPRKAETTDAASSTSTSGLRKRERNSRITARSRCGRSVFGPTAARRVAASASANPCGPVRKLASRSSSERCQKASITARYARQGSAS